MIKCGKLKGAEQCILYSKDGSKVLGRFAYAKHGGQKGAKAAAHKREGQIQFFKKKSVEAAAEQFGTVPVLAYLVKHSPELRSGLAAYVEKAKEVAGKPPTGWNMPPSWQKKPKATLAKVWKSVGASHHGCVAHFKEKGGIGNVNQFCAALKDAATGTTKWRGKKKSFEDEVEEALQMLTKETKEVKEEGEKTKLDELLQNVDLGELAEFLEEWGNDPESEPESKLETEPEPAPELEPVTGEEEIPEEWEEDFLALIRVHHQERKAVVHEAIFGPEEDEEE